jgi:hypothetical protein
MGAKREIDVNNGFYNMDAEGDTNLDFFNI